jgi:predicted SAM-dependent methyltransferase
MLIIGHTPDLTISRKANERLKDDFGGRHTRVMVNAKVMSHLMFGVLASTANQLFRLLQIKGAQPIRC